MSIFEEASRIKLRFASSIGTVSVEDLWDMKLTQLDEIAKSLYKQLKESEELSFISEQTKSNKVINLRFDIVKSVIATRLEETKIKEQRKAQAERRRVILEVLESKQSDELKTKSIDELRKELLELEV